MHRGKIGLGALLVSFGVAGVFLFQSLIVTCPKAWLGLSNPFSGIDYVCTPSMLGPFTLFTAMFGLLFVSGAWFFQNGLRGSQAPELRQRRGEKILLGGLIIFLAIWMSYLLSMYDHCFKRWLGIKMSFLEDEASIGCNSPTYLSIIGIMISIVGVATVFGPWFVWKGLKDQRKGVIYPP